MHTESPRLAALSLLSAAAVRERAHEMAALAIEGRLDHLTVDLARLPAVADYVVDVIRDNYPSLRVPFHARWRHFVVAGRDLFAERAAAISWPDAASTRSGSAGSLENAPASNMRSEASASPSERPSAAPVAGSR